MNEKEIIDYWLNMEQQQPVQLAIQDAYWQQARIQFIGDALNGLTSNPSFENHTLEDVVAECITLADALIAELRKEEKNDTYR